MSEILVVYYSRTGNTEALARAVCEGIDAVPGMAARLRTVPPVSAVSETSADDVPESGPPYATNRDLEECAGLILGSPAHFGNMAAPLKHFLDGTGSEWLSGVLSGKPASAFTSSSSLHGGQESTILTMALPLLHHGMLYVGLPYSEKALTSTASGGTPYGVSQVSGGRRTAALSDEEKALARAVGRRVAEVAKRLAT